MLNRVEEFKNHVEIALKSALDTDMGSPIRLSHRQNEDNRADDLNELEDMVEKMYKEMSKKESEWDAERSAYEQAKQRDARTIDDLKKEKDEEQEEMQQEIDYLNQQLGSIHQ